MKERKIGHNVLLYNVRERGVVSVLCQGIQYRKCPLTKEPFTSRETYHLPLSITANGVGLAEGRTSCKDNSRIRQQVAKQCISRKESVKKKKINR